MNILYIHQYFVTPHEAGGTRSYWISKELVKRGHNVIMLTSTNKGDKKSFIKNVDGIKVIYVRNNYTNSMSKIQKIISFFSFIFKAIKESVKLKDIDVVFATSTPLTIGYIAMFLKKWKGWPYVFEVRDLWPEFPIQIGVIRNKFIIKYLKCLERRIYKYSEHVIALSPGMRDGVLKAGILPDKCSMIPNMSKPDKFYPHEKSNDIIKQFKINTDKFNVIHFGSMGVANGLSYIIEAAKYLKEMGDDSIAFIFMGSGATLFNLEKLVVDYGLSNVQFLGSHKMSVVAEVVNCCDMSIICFLDLPILYTNSPNKLFDSLSAGIPIIVNSAGWTKELCENESCGFYVDPQNPLDLAQKLLKYKDNKTLLNTWSTNSRRLSIEVFDKRILSAKVVDILENVYKNTIMQ